MTDQVETKPKRTRTRKPANKAGATAFKPIDPAPGDKPFISHEAQLQFHALLQSMTPDQRSGAIAVMNYVTKGPGINEGYRRVMHWWRAYAPQLNADNVKL